MALALYRLAGFISILEAAFTIAQQYLLEYHSFYDGKMNSKMFDALQHTVDRLFSSSTASSTPYSIVVSKEIAQRAYEVTMANIEQYKLLMYVTSDDINNWSLVKYARMKTSSNLSKSSSACTASVSSEDSPEFKKETDALKSMILLHDSLIFIKTGLYPHRPLKNASNFLERILLRELVDGGYLIEVEDGIVSKNNKMKVYIKIIPTEQSLPQFIHRLSIFNRTELTYAAYMEKCKKIHVNTEGIVSRKIFEILNRTEYQVLNLDYSCLYQLNKRE